MALGAWAALGLGCAQKHPDAPTIASLHARPATLDENQPAVQDAREQAIAGYRRVSQGQELERISPEALRRLADLQLAREDERLGRAEPQVGYPSQSLDSAATYKASIALYEQVLRRYPGYQVNDQVLYQLAMGYEHMGERGQALKMLDRLVTERPQSAYYPEAQFRRGEILFVDKDYRGAEQAYRAVVEVGEGTPYAQHSLYKLGWSLFKQNDYEGALGAFTGLLDRQLSGKTKTADLATLGRAQRELVDDTLRVVSLCFSYLSGADAVREYYADRGGRPYEVLIYDRLGEMYVQNERYTDAAQVFAAFVSLYPDHDEAPLFQDQVIQAYQSGRFSAFVLPAKKDYVDRFGLASPYWRHHDKAHYPQVLASLKTNLADLARHYHALAQKTKQRPDYEQAITWYRRYLGSFPDDPKAGEMHFLLAELLYETRHDLEAAQEYEHAAYERPTYARAPEAGYAALIAYQRKLDGAKGQAWKAVKAQAISSALRFAERFANHARAPKVLTKASEDLYALGQSAQARATAQRVIERYPDLKPALRLTALTVWGHAAFDDQDYAQAESAYRSALGLVGRDPKKRPQMEKRLAAAIYQQGQVAEQAGDPGAAVAHYLRVGEVLPKAGIRATAEYDAAALLIKTQDWGRAARVLERFRASHPQHELLAQVTQKLAVVYERGGHSAQAAVEYARIGRESAQPELAREALWHAAELYAKAHRETQAIETYKAYIGRFAQPVEPAIEARHRVAEIYRARGEARKRGYWLKEIVKADQKAGKGRSERTRYLAAHAALTLAEPLYQSYRSARLVAPLKKSLKQKKRAMERLLDAYAKAADYGVESVATQSTYRIASVYQDFGRALMDSERPRGLAGEEREQYEILLEEQSFPFEEKAIEVHRVNLDRLSQGVYDEWVAKSIASLAELVPVRYARAEKGEAYVESIQ
jgi:TolA-binding protein